MTIEIKICGLMDGAAVQAAVEGGADDLGFVFFEPSPRNVTPQMAAALLDPVPDGVLKVGLFVDPDDATLAHVLAHVRLDMIQLHGGETPDRVEMVRANFGLPVMKAIAIAGPNDVATARTYEHVADRLLFDAKAPADATRPGGNALAFDWQLLRDESWACPWMLAGGLHAGNVAQAIAASGAGAVDVSSGVEDAPGVKNPAKIAAFIDAVGAL